MSRSYLRTPWKRRGADRAAEADLGESLVPASAVSQGENTDGGALTDGGAITDGGATSGGEATRSRTPRSARRRNGRNGKLHNVSPKDLTCLINKAIENQRHEVVGDGIASVRHALGQRFPDMGARMGLMSAKKVCEIHRMMITEMEESMREKLGFAFNLFHSWRCVVRLDSKGRECDLHLETKKSQWEKAHEDKKAEMERLVELEHERLRKLSKKWQTASKILVDKWASNGTEDDLACMVRSWRAITEYLRYERGQEERLLQVAKLGHGMVLKWIEGDDKACMHACLLAWIQDYAALVAEKQTRTKMEALLDDERRKHEELFQDKRTELEREKDQQRAAVDYALARWQLGDDGALASKLVAAWRQCVRQEKKLSQEAQAVHFAMLRAIEGDTRGALHATFMNWKAWQHHEKMQREGEAALREQHKRWEKLIEDRDRSHDDEVNAYMTEAQKVVARAHEATELMLRQWLLGDAKGVLATTLVEWKTYVALVADDQRKRQTVHSAMLKFLEGEKQAVLTLCMLNWKQYTKVQLVYKREVAERDRAISKLEEKGRHLLGSTQDRTLKYMGMLFNCDDETLLLMVMNRWHLVADGVQCFEERRRLEQNLEEQKRLNELAKAKHKHLIAASLHALNSKDIMALAIDIFTAWTYYAKHGKQEWAHKLVNDKTVQKFAKHTLGHLLNRDSQSLLASVFWELVRETREQHHIRDREEAEKLQNEKLDELQLHDNECRDFEAELQRAKREIDRLTKNLNAEQDGRQQLETELEEVSEETRRRQSANGRTSGARSPPPSSVRR